MFLLPVQEPYDSLTLPTTASYLLFANVTLANPGGLPGGSCQLVDGSNQDTLDSVPIPIGPGAVQVSLTATDTVTAGTAVEVTCASEFLVAITVNTAGIAAIQF